MVFPSTSAAEKTGKVNALRKAFGTSAWTELEEDEKKFPYEKLQAGREKLQTILKEVKNGTNT